ncbi:LPD38 domain-containing protein [Pseudomonas leptonychotis]|uniref:LPD38 domain-containing protein n=1 Tax=Pseudomonas leptonychotis TaxID=2448482 RepID=UPI00386C10D1
MANFFDQFDAADGGEAGNFFDQFDDSGAKASAKQNTSLMGDLGTDLKRGVQKLPGIVTGLADIPVAALTNKRFVDETADKVGELTGFQPKQWAEEARDEYSPERQAGSAEIDQAWQDGTVMDVAGAYATNPGNVAGLVAESLPQMLAGGVIGRGALVAGRATGVIGAPTTAAQAATQGAIAGGAGEGAVIAGGTMDQIDRDVEPRRAAAAAAGAGAVGGVVGVLGAKAAQGMGVVDAESLIAGGAGQVAGEAPGLARRVAGGALAEGVLEELPQSATETVIQNWAEEKDLTEGLARAAVEGTLAGSAIGAGVNVLPPRKRSEEMGLDPNAGPLSAAAVTAVDSEQALLPAPERLALPAPDQTLYADGQGNVSEQGPARDVDREQRPVPGREQPARDFGPGMDQQVERGTVPVAGELMPAALPDAPVQEGAEPRTFDARPERQGIPDLREDSINVDADGNAVPGKIPTPRPADYVQGGRGMDQQAPVGKTYSNVLAAKNAIQRAGSADVLEAVQVGPKQFEVRAIAPPAASQETPVVAPAPAQPPVADAPIVAPPAKVTAAPVAAPTAKPAPVKPAPQPVDRKGLPEVLRNPKKMVIARMAKAAGIKKGSPGYDAAVGRLESDYERQVDDAQAALPFEQFNALNKESPEGLNRQAWTQLRKERGIDSADTQAPKAKPAKSIKGADIDGDWAAFSKDSGSLSIPRAEMPQINAEHRGAMVNFLNARDIAHAEETIAADKLKPTQAEYSTKKVEKAKAFQGGDRSILISSDGHVLDGHHQWLAKRDAGEDVKVIRLDAPIRQLLDTVAEFPSATTDDATGENAPQYSRQSYRQGQAGDGSRAVQLRMQLKRLTGGWQNAPDIKVVQSVKDLPDAQRHQVERDGAFDVEGMFADGQVYLVADNLRDVKHAAFVLQHEVLGHAGLQGAYGKRLTPLLMSIYNSNAELKSQADALVQRFGYQPAVAMEEVLADMAAAGTIQQQPFWPRLVTAMRNALRSIGVGLTWSEGDVQALLSNARRYIENGRGRPGVRAAFSRDGRSGRGPEIADEQGRLLAPNGKASKLNQKQWHQARLPSFKQWFGNWQGLNAEQRLDAMKPLKLRMPEAWQGMSEDQKLSGLKEALKGMVSRSEVLHHAELGDVRMYMGGIKKATHAAADPAKKAVLAKLRESFEGAVYFGYKPDSKGRPDILAFHRLMMPINLDGQELVAIFTLKESRQGQFFYNAVTVARKEEAPAAYPGEVSRAQITTPAFTGASASAASPRDMAREGQRSTSANTETEAFVRQPLRRVNPADVSKVTDGNGEPLVLYHGTAEQFNVFDQSRAGRSTGHMTAPLGIFLTNDGTLAKAYAEKATDGMPGLANVMPLFVQIKKPYRMSVAESQEVDTFEKAIALRQRLEREGYDGVQLGNTGTWVAFYNNQVKSATNNTGAFDEVDPDIRYRRSDQATLDAVESLDAQSAAWSSPSASQWDDLTYKLQDKHIDTKRVLEAIRATGKAIGDDLDVYLQEELYHGRTAKRTEDFVTQELEPLMQYLAKAGLKMQDVEEYLHARHAREANRVIAERNPKLPDGGSGMTNAEADAVLAAYNGIRRKQLEAAAAKVDAIIAGTRQTFVEYGLESQAAVDAWGKTFAHYVPLMREQEGEAGMAGLGTGQGFSVKGKETKGRTGSTRKVVDILANIAMQRERAIVRGEKNRVATALVGLAKANPSDLWQVDVVPTQQVLGKDGKVQTQADSLYKQRNNVVVAKIPDADGTVIERAVVFNEDDPRALRMAVALKNLDAQQLEGLLGATAKVTRYLAAVNTQYNPIFGATNLARDVQGAALNLSSTPLAGKQREVLGQSASALSGIYADMRSRTKGKGGTGSEWAKLWEEFQDVGGQTGYRDQFRTSADRGEALAQALDPSAWTETQWGRFFTVGGRLKVPMEVARKAMKPLFAWLNDYNTAIENSVRLAAYKSALDAGMSKAQAASLAKNLTTNFNRKGQSATQVGALYAFFNASVQGTARIGDTLFDMEPGKPKTLRLSAVGKKIVVGGVMLGGLQALLLAAAGFDDDEPPEFIRERNLIIPTGGKNYITIPMPLGFHVLPNLGRIPMEFALSGFDKPAERVVGLLGLFSDAFNPIGSSGLSMQTLAPSVLDPLAALAENKDFSGRAIAKESFNKLTPGHALARDTASLPALWVAEGINYLTGGTKHVRGALSPTPDQIDYLVGQLTGGVGREVSKTLQTTQALVGGDDLPAHKVPLLGRFYGDADSPSAKQAAFYRNLDDVRLHAEQVKGLRLEGKTQEANTYAQEHKQARLRLAANAADREVRKLRERRRELEQQGASREMVRAIELRMTERMERFSALVKQ